ncbi:MAG TPA: hypothetical protein VGF61_07560 [Candidatus Acidoferrum sp.]
MNFPLFACNLPRVNLHAQIALVLLLSIGVLLARAKRFRLHAALQSAVVLLNLGFILRIMLPSLRHQLPGSFLTSWRDLPVATVLLHSFIGTWRGLRLAASFWLPAHRLFRVDSVSRTTVAGCGPHSRCGGRHSCWGALCITSCM